MEKRKHDYREASKSDHFAKEDLLAIGGTAILEVERTEWFDTRKINGRSYDNVIIAFFKDRRLKPWKINMGNSKIIAGLFGSRLVEDWKNYKLEFYVDHSVKLNREVVGGIKVRECPKLEVFTANHPQWAMGVERVREGMTFEGINSIFSVTEEVYNQLKIEAGVQ